MPSRTLYAFTLAAATVLASAVGCSQSVAAVIAPAGDLVPVFTPRANAARPEVRWFARPSPPGSTVLYVANYYAGTVDVSAGAQPPVSAQIVHLAAPTGLAVDAHGNLYVAEMARHEVLEFPPDLSRVIHSFTVGGSGNGNGLPLGVAVTPDGRKLYAADAERNGAVEVFAPPKRTAVQVLRDARLAGGALYPALDTAGNVYVTYRPSPAAEDMFALGIFSAAGRFQTTTLPGNPAAAVPDGSGNLLVDDYDWINGSTIWTYTAGAKTLPAEFGLPFASEAFTRSIGNSAIFAAALANAVIEVPYPSGLQGTTFQDGDRHYGIAIFPPAALGAPWTRVTPLTEYQIPTADSMPYGIAPGPDGALWFTETNANKIGRITTSGSFREYSIATPNGFPESITTGPDSALWFTEYYGNKIGRISTTGRITEYPVPTPSSLPFSITTGADHALWFTENFSNKVGRITTAGRVTEYAGSPEDCGPGAIAAGPDGALWIIDAGNGYGFCKRVGRITTRGSFSEFPEPVTTSSTRQGITAGPDGALWFTVQASEDPRGDMVADMVCRLTTAGILTEFPVANYTFPGTIAVGPDRALWFAQDTEFSEIGRMTTTGSLTEYVIPTFGAWPEGVAAGRDGGVWFTENLGNKIGRIQP